MNPLLFDELLYKLAIAEDLVSADVLSRVRKLAKDDPSLLEYTKAVPNRAGQLVSFETRVDAMRHQYSLARKLEKFVLELGARESGLRGRLQEALLDCTVLEPGNVRDAVRYAQALGQNPQPGAIAEALDLLKEFGPAAHEPLFAEFLALYPPDPDDERE